MTSLGFETILISNYAYGDDGLHCLFDLLTPLGVRNFIFLFDFDFSQNSFTLQNQKLRNFEERANKFLPRGFHAYAKHKLVLCQGCSFNKDFKKVYAYNKTRALFSAYPIFSDTFRYDIAKDINQILYRHKCFTVFTEFNNVVETSARQTYSKLFGISNAAFGFDINYMLRLEKYDLIEFLLQNGNMLMPMITHDISVYSGTLSQAEYFASEVDKKTYYSLCRSFERCSSKLGF